jgi:hypothetical protein
MHTASEFAFQQFVDHSVALYKTFAREFLADRHHFEVTFRPIRHAMPMTFISHVQVLQTKALHQSLFYSLASVQSGFPWSDPIALADSSSMLSCRLIPWSTV